MQDLFLLKRDINVQLYCIVLSWQIDVHASLLLSLFHWLKLSLQRKKEMELENQLSGGPGMFDASEVNVCFPSPPNNLDPKTDKFNM